MKKNLLNNMLTFAVSTATLGFLFVLAVVAARVLGPEDFGIFSFALAFVFFFDFVLDPGLYHLLIREISREQGDARRYMVNAFAWKAVSFPLVFLLIWLVINLLHDSDRIQNTVYLIAVASFIKSLKDVFRSNLLARERYGLEAVSAFIEKGGLLAVGSLALVMGYGLYGLCWSFVIVRTVDLIIIRMITKRALADERALGGIDVRFLAGMLRAGIPIGIYYVTLNVYNYIDSVMISVMRSQAEVGWYSASYKVYEGLLVIPVVIGTVLLPRLSLCREDDGGEFSALVGRGWKYSLIFALVVTAVGMPLASEFIGLVYGDSYSESVIVLRILLVGIAFAYMVNLLQTVIISIDQQKTLVFIAMIGLALNVFLNYLVIPRYGYSGAAAVTILVEAIVFALLTRQLSILTPGVAGTPVLFRVVGCWIAVGGFVQFALFRFPGFVQASVWLAGFLLVLRLFRLVSDEEWSYLLNTFRYLFKSRQARS